MGITGLLPFLEKSSSKVHLKHLNGTTMAIDSYCLLHRGVYSVADKLARGEDSDKYVQYCLLYVNMLLKYHIKPIMVFDGRHLPAKELTEQRRRESRRDAKKRAIELLRLGDVEEAKKLFKRCVDVTHQMALKLIRECRARNVDCIVAPYEADAQMAWLNKVGIADYVITEDSDLTLFGAQKIIYKLDLTGAGLLVENNKLYLSMGCSQEKYKFDKFRRMCILSGCDYLDSLPGIGLVKGCKFFLITEQDDMRLALKKIPWYLNMRNLQVDEEYIENFMKAEATFKHMFIYNPLKRKMERLNPLEDYGTDERYCSNAGTPIADENLAFQLALGNLDPFTLKQLDNWHPDRDADQHQLKEQQKSSFGQIKRCPSRSIWNTTNGVYEKMTDKTEKPLESKCGIFFKRIDFISKTVDDEITTVAKIENAKPDEMEVFSMYRHKVDEMTEENENSMDCDVTPPTSSTSSTPPTAHTPSKKDVKVSDSNDNLAKQPSLQTASPMKVSHNPFLKARQLPINGQSSSNQPVCQNNSLLKILSPKKMKILQNDQPPRQVEVKSRFFATNVEVVQKQLTTSIRLPDVTKEIEMMENLSQEKRNNRLNLYESPSPKKSITTNVEPAVPVDQCTASKTNDETILEEDHSESEKGIQTSQESVASSSSNETEVESIILSDDENHLNSIVPSKRNFQLNGFQNKGRRRLGLRPPPPIAKQKQKKKMQTFTSSAAITESTTAVGSQSTQSRLFMFGFQKKPVLK